MNLLLDQPMAGGATLYPHAQPGFPGLQAAEDFYLRGADGETERRIQILVRGPDGSLRRTWLAAYAEEHINNFLRLRRGWDGYRAQPLSDAALEAATDLLFAITDDLSLPPQLFPLPDGGVQLEWHAAGEDVEIEVDGTGSAHVLATDATGAIVVDEELTPDRPQALRPIRAAVRQLSARLAGAR